MAKAKTARASSGQAARGSDGAPTADSLLAGIRRWVEIESQTADRDGVNACMTLAADEFADFGAEVERVRGRDGFGDHLKVSVPGQTDGKCVLVLCHLDTVHPKGTIGRELPFKVDGDKVYGPGIYDMKGGAYLALAALREMHREGKKPLLPVKLLYVSDEEVGSPTSQALIEAEAKGAKFVLVTEPARDGGKIVVSRKSVGRYIIRCEGWPAHAGARHEDGRSAILEMAHQIIAIEGMTDYKRGITTCVGQINGGTADNVIPQFCTAAIDFRAITPEDAAEIDQRLKALKPHNKDVKITVTGGINRPAFPETPGGRKLFEHTRTLAKGLGIDLIGVSTGGGSDGNFTALVAPTLDGLGVDGAGAHTHQEYLLKSSLLPRMHLQKLLFETLM